ncbi:hypothetical protein AV530_007463 [Patagioenas fasciata monilis]|uniref:Uncharacterized protein n=1 Tax=Patagioenas fasciata monilis TaxID=372326 RepID=A0A1V4JY64_PATFA|nr:hypothetical protein AV530_007463 [Patagioenas fasciata monilis]
MGISNSREWELAGSVGPSSSDTRSSEKGPEEGELLQQMLFEVVFGTSSWVLISSWGRKKDICREERGCSRWQRE